ncbi:MarR family winged helix-turn-helix transcriptional regulator [Streptomyces wuyuanensis]|uniref:MarR family winged helix-turn-helix transcriptional regulator n=1 Tax=Streptomyces wuyuanensis TaxID=1196353 RepID=UPI00341B3C57
MITRRPYSMDFLPEGVKPRPHMPIRRAITDFVGEYVLDYEQAAQAENLTVAQARVLSFTIDGLSMGEIAQRFGCDPSNITAKVNRLAALGLVERQADPTDARIKRIAATAAGINTAARICDRSTWFNSVIAQLSPTEAGTVQQALDLLLRTPPTNTKQKKPRAT